MTYRNYTDTDFIKDEFFIRWVYHPDEETDLFWKRWIANNPDKRSEIEVAREFLEKIRFEDEYTLPEKDFSRIHENILRYNKGQRHRELDRSKTFHYNYIGSLAAAIIFLIVSVGVFLYFHQKHQMPEQEITYLLRKTEKGEKRTITLPDGTKIKLNAASSLHYPSTFNKEKREVFLNGEAFFEVARDIERPFIVHSKDVKTHVLGTSFNIRAYAEETETKVALVNGKVQVRAANKADPLLLAPNEMLVYDQTNDKFIKRRFDFKKEIGWKDGILSFDSASLGNVFKELEQWYGVEIQVGKGISLTDVYKGDFYNESLDNALSGIGYTSDFDYQINGKNVLIYATDKEPMKTD